MKRSGTLKVKAKTLAEAVKKARRRLSKKYTITASGIATGQKNKKVKTYNIDYRLKQAYQKVGKPIYKKGKRIRNR
jgi:hypothetical protein